ncbi:hypothetical protein FRX31_017810, partial [Thalictrum thalictroides]
VQVDPSGIHVYPKSLKNFIHNCYGLLFYSTPYSLPSSTLLLLLSPIEQPNRLSNKVLKL